MTISLAVGGGDLVPSVYCTHAYEPVRGEVSPVLYIAHLQHVCEYQAKHCSAGNDKRALTDRAPIFRAQEGQKCRRRGTTYF